MPPSQKLQLKQSQAPVMTPRLQLSLQLLQLSQAELSAHVERELSENPFLGRRDGEPGETVSASTDEWIDETPGEGADLHEYLAGQIGLVIDDDRERGIAMRLLEAVDEAGYLSGSLDEIAAEAGCSTEQVEAVLRRLQGLEPAGVFARSLSECLALQLSDRNLLTPAFQALLDHLDLLASGELGKLQQLCGVDGAALGAMASQLRALDPKPGLGFNTRAPETLIPDLVARRRGRRGWEVLANEAALPQLLVDRGYYDDMASSVRRKADRAYLHDRLQSANFLIRALAQRTETLLSVGREIVIHQSDFLEEGAIAMRPLTMREVAEAVSMHESTVSRAVANKYVATPRGTYPLRYFFTAALPAERGASHAAEAVRERVRLLIVAEPPERPLSDEAIARHLAREGIDVARRTVAKYRAQLEIPGTAARRRRRRLGS